MGKQIIYVPSVYSNATARYNFLESYNGINNFADFVSTYAGVMFRGDATGSRIDYKCGVTFNAGKLNKFSMKLDAWYWAVNQLLTDINISIGRGSATNSDALFLLSLFTNLSYFKTSNFGIFTDAVSYFSNKSFFVPCRFSPNLNIGDSTVINGVVGVFGTNSIVDGANTVTISGLDSLNGKSATFAFKHIDGSGNIVNMNSATATITGGKFTGTLTIALTPGEKVYPVFTSINGWVISDFGGNIVSANIGFGAGFAGANAANMIDDGNGAFVWTP